MSTEIYKAILNQFHRKELIKLQPFVGGAFLTQVRAEAHDFILAGGYTAEVDLVELQFEKLKIELLALEKALTHQQFEKIKSITDVLIAGWSALLLK